MKKICNSIQYTQHKDLHTHICADLKERDQWVYDIICTVSAQAVQVNSWGPKINCPPVVFPQAVDLLDWKRKRIIDIAKKYIGLPYRHHYNPYWIAPEGQGLDCSNLTSWVYNYGLGIKFTSHVEWQGEGPKAPGRVLGKHEHYKPGDLLFLQNKKRTKISHVVIYVDPENIIDTRGKGGCQMRRLKGWYKTHIIVARRIIE